MLRRRGKGEASFLHCKSPGREEPDVTSRGRGMEGEKERQKSGEDGEKSGEVETEVGQKKMWEKRGRNREGKKKKIRQKEVLDESRGRGDTGH